MSCDEIFHRLCVLLLSAATLVGVQRRTTAYVRPFLNVFGRLRTCLDVFGRVRMLWDVFGRVRMCSEVFGSVRTRSDAFGRCRTINIRLLRAPIKTLYYPFWNA